MALKKVVIDDSDLSTDWIRYTKAKKTPTSSASLDIVAAVTTKVINGQGKQKKKSGI